MNAKEILTISLNAAIAGGMLTLYGLGRFTFWQLFALLLLMLVPGAGNLLLEKLAGRFVSKLTDEEKEKP